MKNEQRVVVNINPYPYNCHGWAKGRFCKRYVGPDRLYCFNHLDQAPWNNNRLEKIAVYDN